jgi:hypothetical protein
MTYLEAMDSPAVLVTAGFLSLVLAWHFRLLRKDEPGLSILDPFGMMNAVFVALLVAAFAVTVHTVATGEERLNAAACSRMKLYETLRDKDCRVVNAHSPSGDQVFTCAGEICYLYGEVLRCQTGEVSLSCAEDL